MFPSCVPVILPSLISPPHLSNISLINIRVNETSTYAQCTSRVFPVYHLQHESVQFSTASDAVQMYVLYVCGVTVFTSGHLADPLVFGVTGLRHESVGQVSVHATIPPVVLLILVLYEGRHHLRQKP